METNSENILIQECKSGNSVSFGILIRKYNKKLFYYLLKLSGNRELAEDLMQEILIKVWQAFPRYNEENKFSSWLFTIAHNASMDTIRKNIKNDKYLNSVEIGSIVSNENPLNNLEVNEAKEIINNIVESLPIKQKEVFLLRTQTEISFKEISEITGEPLNTVLSHMNYSVKKIRKALENEYSK